MTPPLPVAVHRLDRDSTDTFGLSALLTAYHLRTEAEKGAAVGGVDELPARYRAEVVDPRATFADDTVLVARWGDVPAGCLVVTAPVSGRAELKRLWTAPELRGHGVASTLVHAGLAQAAGEGADTVALSVWQWRAGAIGLYERLGFAVVDPWDARPGLVCMERAVERTPIG